MEKVNLNSFRIPNNLVLIKPDPDFEFVVVKPAPGFDGIIEPAKIYIGATSETQAKHYGITGKILALPEKLSFNKKRIEDFSRGKSGTPGDMYNVSSLMAGSQHIDVDMETEIGDKVWFSYLCQINAVEQKLIIDIEGHGLCFLAKYEDLYCYERDGEVNLINGWIWIQRIKRSEKTDAGLKLQWDDKSAYEPNKAIIVKSSAPVREYMEGGSEDDIDFNGGEMVLYNGKMGHSLEEGMHRVLTDGEVLSIRRRHIYAVI